MRTRLINLERSTDRLALFHARNPHCGNIVRTRAIDGKSVDRSAMVAAGVMQPDLSYSDGALGCALSHLKLWRDAVQTNQPITIIEDDAVLCANFETEVASRIALLPADWDYVMWGYNFDAPLTFHLGADLSQCTCVFNQDMMRCSAPSFSQKSVETHLLKLLRGFGTMAYSISPRGAERLINFCLPLRPLTTVHPGLPGVVSNRRIDSMIANAWPSMSAFVAMPPLAISENESDASTVQATHFPRLAYPEDPFPPQALAAVVQTLDTPRGGVVVGVRATHEMELASIRLRQAGWTGFDIAIDPAKAVAALKDRGIGKHFDLLYIGPGCNISGLLSAILASFCPRAILMPPEHAIMAHHLTFSEPQNDDRPGYGELAETSGYTVTSIIEAPKYRLLLQKEVYERSAGRPFGTIASTGIEEVRLWH